MPTEQEIKAQQQAALAKVPKATHAGVTKDLIEQRKAINENTAPSLSGYKEPKPAPKPAVAPVTQPVKPAVPVAPK